MTLQHGETQKPPTHQTLGTFLTSGHHSWLNKCGNMW